MSEVAVGQDGWLFLTGGSNDVLNFYTDASYFAEEEISSWVSLLEQRTLLLKEQGILYRHLTVPDKLSIMSEYFVGDLPAFSNRPGWQTFRKATLAGLGDVVLNGERALLNAKGTTGGVYFKTDSHWTYEGCLACYKIICESCGVSPLEDLATRNYAEVELVLDLGGKFSPPLTEVAKFYHVTKYARRVFANAIVYEMERLKFRQVVGLLKSSQVVFENHHSSAHPAKVVLFGDSFSEVRTHLLTGMLAETFREVHFFWSSSIDLNYVWKVRPDIVITQIAERFMKRIPDDSVDLVALADQRMTNYLALNDRSLLRP